MRCRLLLAIIALSVCQTVGLSVYLSCGSAQLHCARAERIKIVFGVNIPEAQGTLCYTGVLIPYSKKEQDLRKFCQLWTLSRLAEARDLKKSNLQRPRREGWAAS